MRKILSIFSVLLLAGSLWAADVTVTESFQTWPYTKAQTKRVSYTGDNYVMWVRGVRYGGTNDKLKDNTKGFWMSRGSSSSCYVETENGAIGGIKAVSFKWRQFGTESSKLTLKLQVKINGTQKDLISQASGQTYIDNDQSYSKSDFNFKANAKLTIANVSDSAGVDPKTNARIILGPITITPYLYYGSRVVTIGLQQKGYKNTSLINNTGTTPAFSSSEETVATVEADGTIVPVAAGKTTITASWEQVTVSYELNVKEENILVENFSLVNQSKLATTATSWTGDVCSWTVDSVRKAINDTTCNNPRIQGTYSVINAYLTTAAAFEGGIKHLYFKWQQWGSESDKTLKLNVKAGAYDNTVSVAGVAGGAQQEQTFDADLNVNSAQTLTIKNVSELTAGGTPTSNARIVISDMRFTPYLLYTLKIDTLDMSESTTYTNTHLIDNRDNANAIAYSILEGPATINGDVVTATAAGTVKVQAKWDNVTTTYTLVVKNSSQHLLTWNADGGTLEGGTEAGLVTKGTALTAPTATKTGYKHTGWDPEVPEVMPDNDFTSTAQYEAKQCNITLKSNYEGGEEDIEFVATFGQPSPKDGQTLFTRTGYSINKGYWKDPVTEAGGTRLLNTTGRFTTDVNGYTSGQNWARDAEEDITLYAHWNINTYKITYANMEGATNFEAAPATYTIETPTITLGTPTKTGYTFAGWKANDAEGATVTEIAQGSIGDTTLYATWTVNKTTVHFIANGGDATATFDAEVEYGTRVAILSKADVDSKLTRENYTFNNYYTAEEGGLRMTNVVGSGKLYFISGARDGYLDAEGKWIKDGGEATFYAHWTLSTLVLNEGEDNSAMLSEANGKTVDVTMTRSALVANVWNSLCLPFAIDKSDLGENAQVVEMTGAEMQGDVINVTFAEFNSTTLEAATPYLVKPTAEVALTTFTDKTIDANPKTIGDNGLIELVGIYSPFGLTANDKSKLFLGQPDGQGNNLYFANQNGSLKGMRAYFNIVNAGAQAAARVGRMVINKETVTTELENVNENANANQKVIINNQLVIIRDGVMYNAMGCEL